MQDQAGRQLVLVGGGHAHAEVLRQLALRPVPGARVLLVAPQALAPYSGMVPGWLAGQHGFEDLCIDIAALARRAGVAHEAQPVVALDAAQRRLQLADGRWLGYDLLSLNIGSTLHPPAVPPAGRCLALRPLAGLAEAWAGLWADPWLVDDPSPLAVTMVGGGAAGVEVMLAVCGTLRRRLPQRTLLPRLVTRSPRLLPGLAEGAARHAEAALQAAGVRLQLDTDARAMLARPARAPGLLLWAAGAQPHDWPVAGGLAADGAGFVQVDGQLRSVSHPEVFAVGDAAGWQPPLPKAGVYAVRQGPALAANLRAALLGQPLQAYRPQAQALALLATADGGAIASWGALAARGAALGRWKTWIDRRFIARYRG